MTPPALLKPLAKLSGAELRALAADYRERATVATKAGYHQALAPSGQLGGRITLVDKGDVLPRAYGGFGWCWIGRAEYDPADASGETTIGGGAVDATSKALVPWLTYP